jgi:chemotaxis protein MotB
MTSPPNESNRLPWTLTGAFAVAALLVLLVVALPARKQRDELSQKVDTLTAELNAAKAATTDQERAISELLEDKDNLAEQKTAVQEQLKLAVEEKEAAVVELSRAKKELESALGTQISSGDVLIQERKGELVIDVSDRLLFNTGETGVNDAGRVLLHDVAKSMKRLSQAQVFRVGGHTDFQRVVTKDLAERYPTNWELSAARATNVVRFLQEEGKVPGHQLIAAGFSQYRPTATNQTDAGRQRNRRIEIVLQRTRKTAS